MKVSDMLVEHKGKIAVVGMGYVGMPLAVGFSNKGIDVIGFDLNQKKFRCIKKVSILQKRSEMKKSKKVR